MSGMRRQVPLFGAIFPSAAVAILLVILSGCMVATTLRGRPGVDLSEVRPGAQRERVEALLGAPLREWRSISGVAFCLYEFDAGVPKSGADAAAAVFLDVISLGLSEIAFGSKTPDELVGARRARRVVSYDATTLVLGVFAENEDLPPDGKRREEQR